MADEIVLNETEMKKLGTRLSSLFDTYKLDRKAAEQRWLRNLRQFRGIYDPEIKIPSDRSRAYPKLTRWKVIGTVARLMQMLFPQTEKNWGLAPSPLPNLAKEQVQEVLDTLVAGKVQEAAAAGQPVDPTMVDCSDEDIEKAIFEYAKKRSERMAVKIDDDLSEMVFINLARKVVFSATLYDVGVLEGPMHETYTVRTWQKNPFTGAYEAVESEKLKPLLDFCPVWNYYPDMTAKTLDQQDGTFIRHVMTRRQVEALKERPDFINANITEWLLKHKDGNWKAEDWETSLQAEKKSDKSSANTDGRKYVVVAYWGDVTGHELAACGATVAETDLSKTFVGNVWLLENVVIKARVAVLNDKARHHHEFVFEEDDLSLLGNGQCDTLRDSQLSICEATRMALDEASIGGENTLIFPEALQPGQSLNQASYKVWKQEGEGNAMQNPAVRPIQRQSRLGELQAMVQMFMEFANNESGLPPPSMGDVSGGGSEALRTQKNASMFLGAAALPIRDTVRNYDMFTTSVISALVEWNRKYDPNSSRDGDHQVLARGSTSLIAKEVLAESLDAFRTTLSPDELPEINTRKLLVERMKARDLSTDILETEEVAAQKRNAQAEQQQKMLDAQIQEIEAGVRQKLADGMKKVAEAHKAEAGIQVDALTLLMEALNGQAVGTGTAAGATP